MQQSDDKLRALTMELSEKDVFVLGCYIQEKRGLDFLPPETAVRHFLAGDRPNEPVPSPERVLEEATAAYEHEWAAAQAAADASVG